MHLRPACELQGSPDYSMSLCPRQQTNAQYNKAFCSLYSEEKGKVRLKPNKPEKRLAAKGRTPNLLDSLGHTVLRTGLATDKMSIGLA